eukprot:TRINITY_DN17489_c0_g1_i2.p1 TRINITY_DN17489_c0_g1~~TRINITY_DN17489_c0_g1_i2.p1  ORF type:complete len:614 (-),score=54.69 TRINITY_DN17489_c0_g1_i2:437-2278(-)
MAYAAETYAIWLALGLDVGCCLIYAFLMCKAIIFDLPWSTLGGTVLARLKTWVERSRLYFGANRSDDPFERKVAQQATDARIDRGKHLIQKAIHLLACIFVFTTLAYGRYDIMAFRDVLYAKAVCHQGSLMLLTLIYVVATFFWLLPRYVTVTTLNVAHIAFILRLCWQAYTSTSVYELHSVEGISVAARFVGALIASTPAYTLTFNCAYVCVKLRTYSGLFDALPDEEKDFVERLWGNLSGAFGAEFCICSSLWLAGTLVETWTLASVRATLQAKTASTSEETVKSMLVVMCDAVVTVDKDLILNKPSSDFAHFLIRRPLNNSYKGASLLDFVEHGDRRRIQQQLTSSAVGPGTAMSLLTTLIDGNGAPLKVQMYCTCFIDIFEDRAYVVGILEVKETADGFGRQELELAEAQDTLASLRDVGCSVHTPSETEGSVGRQSLESESSSITLVAVDHQQYEAFIDIADDDWPILATSLKMRQLSGPQCSGGHTFAEWLNARDIELVERMTEAYEQFREGSAIVQAEFGRIRFRPPHAIQAGLECVAKLTMDMTELAETGPKVPICLRFTDVELRRAKKPPRRRNEMTEVRGTMAASLQIPAVRGRGGRVPEVCL